MSMTPLAERVLYEDNHLLIVNKLPSEIVQGDKTGDTSLIEEVKQYLKFIYNKPGNIFAGLVHRIDRPVGGAVIFAKTSKALSRMTELVKDRDVQKTYLAIVRNHPKDEEASLEHWLLKNEAQNKSYVVDSTRKGAKLAKLDYRIIDKSASFTLLEVHLHTGRHHQIRAQFAAIGCPILGDLKYGDKRTLADSSIALHALRLKFIHPVTGKELIVSALPGKGIQHWDIFASTIDKHYFQ